LPKYEVFLNCPVHKKLVSIVVSASDQEDAKYKILNKVVACPYRTPDMETFLKVKHNLTMDEFAKLSYEERIQMRNEYEKIATPTHNFVVGFREGVKEVLAVRAYPWKPPTVYVNGKIMGPISAAPQTVIPEEVKYVPPAPSEKIYYVEPKIRIERLKRKDWWKT